MYKKSAFLLILLLSQNIFSQISYENVAADLGLNITGNTSAVLGGVSFYDFDNDGWDDLTFGCKDTNPVKFFKNMNGTSFVEQDFGLDITDHSKQVIWVDYDNDGDNDLFVAKFDAANKLYQNDGNFVFTDVTTSAGFSNDILYTFGASFGDYDNDGFLDVFLSNKDFNYIIPNQLYHNNGDGTFTDVTNASGISTVGHLSFCAAFFDYNNDGYQDIYIANDNYNNKNILYKNDGDGTFTDVSLSSGAGIAANAMSTTIDDYNDDGWLDIYVTNTVEGNFLLKNNGDGTFTDVAATSGTIFNSWGWAANFFDADNDLDLDLYVSSRVSDPNSGFLTYALYESISNYNFSIPEDAGFSGDQFKSISNAIGDINNDGYQDLVVCNVAPDNHSLWKNEGGTNNWIKVKLEGVESNFNGIGSWIEVSVDNNIMYRYLLCGEGFLGQNSGTEIFGAGDATNIDYVKITWLSGIVDYFENVTPNTLLTVVEGSSPLSIDDEFRNYDYIIYPNPTDGIVNIANLKTDVDIEVLDFLGRKVKTVSLNPTQNQVDLSDFNKGIYFFSIKNEDTLVSKRVVLY